jgi:hypothetical protein
MTYCRVAARLVVSSVVARARSGPRSIARLLVGLAARPPSLGSCSSCRSGGCSTGLLCSSAGASTSGHGRRGHVGVVVGLHVDVVVTQPVVVSVVVVVVC